MKTLTFLTAAMVMALSTTAAWMQDATPETGVIAVPYPEVVVYEPETGALYNVTAEGIQAGANLSDVAAFAGQNAYGYVLSPDRSKLVFALSEMVTSDQSVTTYYVADVASGACCDMLDPQDANMTGALSAKFNADGTQLAVGYHSNRYDQQIAGQIVIFDVATGDVLARLDSSRLDNSVFGGIPAMGIMMGDWTEAGLVVWPTCVGCEPPLEGVGQVWNPTDDSLSAPTVPFNLLEQILSSGERLRAAFDPAFPNNPDAIGMLPVPNVVTYTVAAEATPQIVYFNPNNIYIYRAQWVADGQAILVQHSDPIEYFMPSSEAYVMLRDGTLVAVSLPVARQFLAATSDGWVMLDSETMTYVYYRLEAGQIREIPLDAPYTGTPVVVEQPTFGASVGEAMFPSVSAP